MTSSDRHIVVETSEEEFEALAAKPAFTLSWAWYRRTCSRSSVHVSW